jgi:hypothetical protein
MNTVIVRCMNGMTKRNYASVTEAVESALLETAHCSLGSAVRGGNVKLTETAHGYVINITGGGARATVMGEDLTDNVRQIIAAA